MAMRALASKIRIPATLRRSPAARPTAPPPQGTAGITVTTPKHAERGLSPQDKTKFKTIDEYEKQLTRDMWKGRFIGTVLGIPGAWLVLYSITLMYDDTDDA